MQQFGLKRLKPKLGDYLIHISQIWLLKPIFGSRKINKSTKLNPIRSELFQMIQSNGGPQGLDLSGRNLSGIDISSDLLRSEMARIGNPYDNPPLWYSTKTGGINLSGANLRNINFQGALLWRGDFQGADFSGAQLQKADFGVSILVKTNLTDAHLERATLARADIEDADFTRAHLEGADIKDVDFSVARSIKGFYLSSAKLGNTGLKREQLRTGLGEEQDRDYYRAKEAYLALKNNFLGQGCYSDASWAYSKERQMERKTHNPLRAWRFYSKLELPTNKLSLLVSLGPFYIRHTVKWLFDWLAYLSCGYGERPFNTIFLAMLFIAIFPFFYEWSGGLSSTKGLSLEWMDYLQYSIASFSTRSLPDIIPISSWAELLTSMEALLGIAMLSLLMFTLGNRIARS